MEIELINIDEIIPYENNAKIHTDEQIEQIKKSILEFGNNDPIAIDKNNVIIEGHGRLLALKELGYKEVEVIKLGHLTDEQRRAYTLIHNKLTMNTGFDMELLIQELEDIQNIDMADFDFDIEIEELEPQEAEEDEYEVELPKEPTAKLGDIYQLGNHRLMCGDSTNKDDVMKLINNTKIDMIFTDPPYGINLNGDNSKRGSKTSLMKGGLKLKSFIDDSIEYAVKAFNIVQDLNITKQVWFGANYYCHHLPQTNNWLIWDKRVEEKMNNTNSDCELAWVLDGHNSCRIYRHLWNGLIKASENGEKRVHPTQKPIALVEHCVNRYAPNTTNILDLFGGSGTTLLASEKMNINCLMMEFDPYYVDVIIDRWETYTGQKAVLL